MWTWASSAKQLTAGVSSSIYATHGATDRAREGVRKAKGTAEGGEEGYWRGGGGDSGGDTIECSDMSMFTSTEKYSLI